MAAIQELDNRQMAEALHAAVDKHVPLTVMVRRDDIWLNLRSRFVGLQEGRLLVEPPSPAPGMSPSDLSAGERIGLSFKLKHHKHLFSSTVVGPGAGEGESPGQVLIVHSPSEMQRLQRRAFLRVDVPKGRIVRAEFWLGGRKGEPVSTSLDRPRWSGRVTNISAGGLRVEAEADPTEILETGDVVGLRLVFGPGEATVYADAQCRHAQARDGKSVMGFQLLGLTETPEGKEALQTILDRVSGFARQARRKAK